MRGFTICCGNLTYHPGFQISPPFAMPARPARTLTFKCKKCAKPVQVFLQKVSACSHIQPYQGICKCGEVMRHATGQKDAVDSFIASGDSGWVHHHH